MVVFLCGPESGHVVLTLRTGVCKRHWCLGIPSPDLEVVPGSKEKGLERGLEDLMASGAS